ncbi:cell division protein FtsX [Thermaurantimonas aggregans]|uniref:cell division protein FtsX n=1 Tax=Thermaurantimonas aggregans TaxID=2173829 RepID=UPI0023F3DEDA|nr:permease-like cell division protein FtsX [Thermaurantimonas aggregans]MCX8149504.1 permease-like cell division protein FtsX [Thermaurantimonas aggregans]
MARTYLKNRLRVNFVSVIISQTLVLFVLGVFGLIVFNARIIAKNLKENLTVLVVLKPEVNPADARRLQKVLETDERIRRTELITREEAAEMLKKDLNEDFIDFLGYNPLSDVIELNVYEQFADEQVIASIEKLLKSEPSVDEVVIDKDLIYLMNSNLKKLTYVALGMVVILLLVSIALINSSIRLSIYSSRFIIRTMQLVGATHWFIIRPFMLNAALQGFVSGLFASGLLLALYKYSLRWTSEMFLQLDETILYINIPLLSTLGVVVSTVCTLFALNKYLRLDIEQLYA